MNNIIPDDLLKEPIVLKQDLQNEPILKFNDFEFSENKKYQPILLRILLNSINIFNFKYDLSRNNDSNFPIGIQIVTGDYQETIMIMFTISESDILTQLIDKGEELFPDPDLDSTNKKKIDINLEEKGSSNEKYPRFNYINGLDFEKNVVSKLKSHFKEDEIKYLPNMFFYIKESSRHRISSKLNLNYTQSGNRNIHAIQKNYYGYNEFDLYVELKKNCFLPKKFECVYLKENSEEKKTNPNIELQEGKRVAFEIKVSNYKIAKDCATKLNSKTKVLSKALYKHGFINNDSINNDILIMAIDCDKSETSNFYKALFLNNIINFVGLYIDISVKYNTIIHLSDEITKIKEDAQKIKTGCDSKIKKIQEDAQKIKTDCDSKIKKMQEDSQKVKIDCDFKIKKMQEETGNQIQELKSLILGIEEKNEKIKSGTEKEGKNIELMKTKFVNNFIDKFKFKYSDFYNKNEKEIVKMICESLELLKIN